MTCPPSSLLRLGWVALWLAGTPAIGKAPASHVTIRFEAAAVVEGRRPSAMVPVDWLSAPTDQDVRREWTTTLRADQYASMSCRFARDGKLSKCRFLRADPADPSTNLFISRVARRFQASKPFMQRYGQQVSSVLLVVSAYNPAGRSPDHRPCHPPFCITESPPPPAPPPR
jgi:hypothetical protein